MQLRKLKLTVGVVLLLVCVLCGIAACSTDDVSALNQSTPIGTIKIWISSVNTRSITGVASCLYEANTSEYSQFVTQNETDYGVFSSVETVGITSYKAIGENDAYALYSVTLTIKRNLTYYDNTENKNITITSTDNVTSSYYLKRGANLKWFFTTEPNPLSGNTAGEGFTLEKEELAVATVSFNSNGGTVIAPQSVTEGSTVAVPTSPEKESYTFSGWYTGQSFEEEWDFATLITADNLEMTLYAKWTKTLGSNVANVSELFSTLSYAITPSASIATHFSIDATIATGRDSYNFSSSVILAPGYDTWGLYADANGTSEINKSVALTAGATTKVYLIISSEDGSVTNIYTVNLYRRQSYVITVADENGVAYEGVPTRNIEENNAIASFPEISRSGYNLVGWKIGQVTVDENYIVTQNVTLTPVWEAVGTAATLQAESGVFVGGATTKSVALTFGESFSLEVPTRQGYTFNGWFFNGGAVTDASGASLAVWSNADGGNAIISARWTAESYTVTYSGVVGATNDNLVEYTYGQYGSGNAYVFNHPIRTGYTFSRWYIYQNGVKTTITRIDETIAGNLTLYAEWEESQYNITYMTFDDAQCDYDSPTIVWKSLSSRAGTAFTPKKYADRIDVSPITVVGLTFVGWYTEPAFTNRVVADTPPVADTILYARWTEEYTEGINYTLVGGTYAVQSYAGSAETIRVPSKYLGVEVISILPNAFAGANITSVDFSAASFLTSIGQQAFSGCARLTAVSVPSGVTTLGTRLFEGCTSLQSLSLPSVPGNLGVLFGSTSLTGLTKVQQAIGAAVSTYYVPSSLRSISVTATAIVDGFAQGMSMLTSITISSVPSTNTAVGSKAFSGCSSLQTISLPSMVSAIGAEAFANCTALSTIQLPTSVMQIGANAFRMVTATVTLPDTLTVLGDYAFCDYRGSTIALNNVETLGANCFKDSINLSSINLASVNSIGASAFENCKALANIGSLSTGLTAIAEKVFFGCIALANISLENGVTSIGSNAFYGCSVLTLTVAFDSTGHVGGGATTVSLGEGWNAGVLNTGYYA